MITCRRGMQKIVYVENGAEEDGAEEDG